MCVYIVYVVLGRPLRVFLVDESVLGEAPAHVVFRCEGGRFRVANEN